MGRRKKQEEHAHAESWLVSYCDMISLLVTFFLMMMTFSTSSSGDVREVGVGILRGRGGIWRNPSSFPEQTSVDPTLVNALARDLAALCESQIGEQSTSIQSRLDGFSISFDLRSSFAPGSTEVTPALRENLLNLSKALQRYTHLVVVEGFTDTEFEPTPEYPTAITLGLARAQAAARCLLENTAVESSQVQVASAGMLRPRAPNDTVTGRTSNRRIEVRVVALAQHAAGHRDSSPAAKQ